MGIFKKSVTFAEPPCAIVTNVENSTITKISSQDAPARIICGMLFCVPHFSSISFTILGTTTAGETALSTAPMTADSIRFTPSRSGANRIYPTISQHAGTNDIITADLPTFFKSERLSDNPAFISIMISAICRSSEDMPSIFESSRSRTYGLTTIPTPSIPIIRGNPIFSNIAAADKPTRKMTASDKIIIIPPNRIKKSR